MLVCCWFDLGLKLLKVENGTFENRTIAGNSHYLVPFGNRTIAGTALIETALTGDPLYHQKNSEILTRPQNLKKNISPLF